MIRKLETKDEVIEYYNDVFDEIKKILQRVPPSYAYGDNEAGCYMANMLQEIDMTIYNAIDLVDDLHEN